MQLVVDANVLFAALLKDSTTRALILSGRLSLIAPEFVVDEITEHLDELSEKASVSKDVLWQLLEELITVAEIKIVPKEDFLESLEDANKISPDSDDVQYFALALKYNCSIWSNDSELKGQKPVKVFNTSDLLKFIGI